MTLDGKPVWEKSFNFNAKPLTSTEVFRDKVSNLLNGLDRRDVIFVTSFATGDRIYNNVGYATKQKNMNYGSPKLTIDIAKADGGYNVTLGSDVFARAVFMSLDGIDNFFSDNYFDILPGAKRTIHVTTPLSRADFEKQLKVISMGDVHAQVAATEAAKLDNSGEFKPLGGN